MVPVRRYGYLLLAGLTAATAGVVLPAGPASAAVGVTGTRTIAPGLTLSTVTGTGSALPVQVFEADLSTPTLGVKYLSGTTVSRSTQTVQAMATGGGAVAAVNGDFWDPVEDGTAAPNGTAISNGTLRSGRAATAGYNGVAAFTPSGAGTLAAYTQLYLKATVTPAGGTAFTADQLNSPLLIADGVGVYSELWGSAPRSSATRNATRVREVVVSQGRVTAVNTTAGGAVAAGSVALVGTGAGVDRLAGLTVGTAVTVDYRPVDAAGQPTAATVAVGAHPSWILVENGTTRTFTDTTTRPRTAIGFSADGTRIWVLAANGDGERGMTFAQTAQTLKELGADDAISLDGGGSTRMVARLPGATAVSAVGGTTTAERPVPNGLSLTSTARSTDCSPSASIFAVAPDGKMYLYGLHDPSTTSTTWEYVNDKNAIGAGWNQFGKVLGGPGGRVYGIKADGLHQYVWGGLTDRWTYPVRSLGTQFSEYALPGSRDKITVDRQGDFYRVDSAGNLIWSRLNEQNWTWSIEQTIATGWDKYDKVLAADAGVLYSRAAADGRLYRSHFDTTSRTWVTKEVWAGAGWDQFGSGVFSAGGNTLFGIPASGDLLQYRHREWNSAWAISGRDIGDGWDDFADVAASPDACRLTAAVYRP
ncbi:phosphodiester glycosidase family protein [Actinoplanes couchii]|uniref:phosphodiester glycosidase family protein n=1 Tax=Actinoplanes couchii TaxID=403638 RepID=UPI00194451F9|nr:tachylectin-related carbohydrate-binding protein [Actinoplanes couchii]MDR6318231.1 exopolysaccharide biosynthesis protein [Actinoplanes couchii]